MKALACLAYKEHFTPIDLGRILNSLEDIQVFFRYRPSSDKTELPPNLVPRLFPLRSMERENIIAAERASLKRASEAAA